MKSFLKIIITLIVAMSLSPVVKVTAQNIQETAPILQAPDTGGKITNPNSTNSTDSTNAADANTKSFKYIATSGQCLTILVRKSLIIYNKNIAKRQISNAAIIYAETNIVNDMGSREIDINETINIDNILLEKYSKLSEQLTAEQLDNWQYYADNADFSLIDVTPVSSGVVNAIDEKPTPTATSESNVDEKTDTTKKSNESSTVSSVTWYWIIAVFGAVAVAYYLLGGSAVKETK